MKTIRILALAAALAAVPAFASDFGHEQALTIDGKPAHLAETSARIFGKRNLDCAATGRRHHRWVGFEKNSGL